MRNVLGVVAFSLSAFVTAHARVQSQATGEAGPAFEVVSIRPQTLDRRAVVQVPSSPTRFSQPDTTVERLIRIAYEEVEWDAQLVGAPGWVKTSRFEFTGLASEPSSQEQKRLMLKRTLADRFGLKVHTETRELPIFALVVARRDGRLGPKLQSSAIDCVAIRNALVNGRASVRTEDRVFCQGRAGLGVGFEVLHLRGESMSQLARSLARPSGRIVVDKTGLMGTFDGDLKFASDWSPRSGATDVPSIFTALEEDLGLKLEAQSAPTEVLVIDSIERPTPD